jgi:very-short-patch-repair endonuclease
MRSELTGLARNLRKRSTDVERLLWRHLRARQPDGLKFRRQQPIGNYIVDFACLERGVVIELDGGQHASQVRKDRRRDRWFEVEGFTVLRFWDNEVLTNTDGVLEVVSESCLDHPPLTPPFKGREWMGAGGAEATEGAPDSKSSATRSETG